MKKVDLSFSSLTAWINDLQGEFESQSDRGLAIVGASLLDRLLEAIFEEFLCGGDKLIQRLFSSDAPLSSFSAKIKLSYCLGLISKVEYRNLEIIRSIRNDFAHELGKISFATQTVRDRCANLTIPYGMYVPRLIPIHPDDEDFTIDLTPPSKDDPRRFYQEVVVYLTHSLLSRWSEVRGKCQPAREYSSAAEGMRIALAEFDRLQVQQQGLREQLREKREDLIERLNQLGPKAASAPELAAEIQGLKEKVQQLGEELSPDAEQDEQKEPLDNVELFKTARPFYEYAIGVIERSLQRGRKQ